MTKSVFIAGVGTDIGKTYVSALIMKKLINEKYNACYFKPVLSGAEYKNGLLFAGDVEYVKNISGLNEKSSALSSYVFLDAYSPHLAAKKAGEKIMINKIVEDYNKLSSKYDYIITEGAGGIICPFSDDANPIYTKDIIKALNMEAVLISTTKLGSINSAMLSIYYMWEKDINIRGIIFNGYKNSEIDNDNIDFIIKHTELKNIAVVEENQSDLICNIQDLIG